MFWWDWPGRRKVTLLGTMLGTAAVPSFLLGWFPFELRAFLGGTAFLMIPQMMALFLVIGLKTGSFPVLYGDKISRREQPFQFCVLAALFAVVLVMALTFIGIVVRDISVEGLN